MGEELSRLEGKVDKCLEAIERLVLIDERQIVQGQRMGQLEQRCTAIEVQAQTQAEKQSEAIRATSAKLEKWINFGLGAYALAATAFTIYQGLHK